MPIDPCDVGRVRIYNSAFRERGRDDVVKWDIFPIVDGELIRVIIEDTNSSWRQGIRLQTDKGIIVNNQMSGVIVLWTDTLPTEVVICCKTENGCLSIYNVWDSHRGLNIESQKLSSGMLIEQYENGRRYFCNDIGFDTNFDKLIFRIERVGRKYNG